MNKPGKLLYKLIIISAAVILITACSTAFAEKNGKVKGGWLILRDAPSYSGKQISSYPSGTIVTITGQNGSWYAVKTPDSLTGYMLGKYLIVSGDDLIAGGDAWVISSNGLNVRMRTGAGTQYKAIASYAPGTKCKLLEKGDKFCKIQIGTSAGYMMTRFLTATDPGTGSGIIQYELYVTSTNGRGVNMRSAPYKANNVIGFYDVGTKAGMITPGPVWSLISINGREGYMMTQFLTKTKPEPIIPTGGSFVISYNGKNVNLRSGPGLKYPILNSYAPGTPVTVLTPGAEWDYIRIGSLYGYMMDQFIVSK
jgi:uncharacterized protein YgiM (DUF1202 family)